MFTQATSWSELSVHFHRHRKKLVPVIAFFFIFSAKRSRLLRNNIIEALANHLELHISSKSSSASTIRLVSPSSNNSWGKNVVNNDRTLRSLARLLHIIFGAIENQPNPMNYLIIRAYCNNVQHCRYSLKAMYPLLSLAPLASNVKHPELVALYDEGVLDYARRACPKHQ